MNDKFYKTGSNVFFILLLLYGIYAIIIAPMIGSHLMKKKSKFAITDGRFTHPAAPRGMGASTSYKFTVNGKIYRGSTSTDGGLLQYHYYFVRFYPDNPIYNSIEKKEAFWYDIKSMPASGFDSIPKH